MIDRCPLAMAEREERERLTVRLAMVFGVSFDTMREATSAFANVRIREEFWNAAKGATVFRAGAIVEWG